MGKLLDAAFEKMGVTKEEMGVVEASSNDSIAKYRRMARNYETMVVTFTSIDRYGNFYFYDEDGNRIRLNGKNSKLDDEIGIEDKMARRNILGLPISVRVLYVTDRNDVYVCRDGADPGSVADDFRKELEDAYAEHRSAHKPLIVPGRVVRVYPNRAIVNIADYGAFGEIDVKDWCKGYTRVLNDGSTCIVDQVYQFEIVGKRSGNNDRRTRWLLSRKNLTKDPWSLIPRSYRKHSVVTVTCVGLNLEKHAWWGHIDGLDGLEIFGNINTRKFPVPIIGARYICNIVDIRPKDHMFKVAPFDYSPDSGVKRHEDGTEVSPSAPIDKPLDAPEEIEEEEE